MTADLERRLSQLEAERAIRALMGAYIAARDVRRDGHQIAALFARDGIWEGTGRHGAQLGRHRGHAAIARRFSGELPPTLHLLYEHEIRVDSDRASGRWSYLAPAVIDDEATWMAGSYDNDFVMHMRHWRFAHVRVQPLLVATHRHGWTTLLELVQHDQRARA